MNPKCSKHHKRTYQCRTCRGSGSFSGIFGLTSGRCTACSGKGYLCPTCGKHWK